MRERAAGKYIPSQDNRQNRVKMNRQGLPEGGEGFIISQVDNPYAIKQKTRKGGLDGDTIKIIRRTSDNPLLLLFTRGHISDTQFLAGHKYRAAYLIGTGQTGQGIDYLRQRVDCASEPLTLTEKYVHARDIIRQVNRRLIAFGHNERGHNSAVIRMQKVAGEGYSVTQYCNNICGLTSSKSVKKHLGFLREDLSILAKFWKLER